MNRRKFLKTAGMAALGLGVLKFKRAPLQIGDRMAIYTDVRSEKHVFLGHGEIDGIIHTPYSSTIAYEFKDMVWSESHPRARRLKKHGITRFVRLFPETRLVKLLPYSYRGSPGGC